MSTYQADEFERIKTRIEALLRLSKSPNEHEAASAARHAQELMQKYNLEMSELSIQDKTDDAPMGREDVDLTGQGVIKTPWVTQLARAVAIANLCDIVYSGKRIVFMGRKYNVDIATYMFRNLYGQLRTMVVSRVKEHTAICKRQGLSVIGGVNDHQVYRRSWLLGAVKEISNQLYLQHREFKMTPKGNELVVYNDQAVAKYVASLFPKLGHFRTSGSTLNPDGFRQGQADGRNISTQPGLGQAAASVKKLGAG